MDRRRCDSWSRSRNCSKSRRAFGSISEPEHSNKILTDTLRGASMANKYDVVVIGAGPAGYTAAIRCAQLGMKTACIDKSFDPDRKPVYGGTCLNWGCIPSKTLLDTSHKFVDAKDHMSTIGIKASKVQLDLAQVMTRKRDVVKKLTSGIGALFQGNGVSGLPGTGKLLKGPRVEYTPHGGSAEILDADHVILAPGSVPVNIEPTPLNGKTVVDSTGALEFTEVPKRLGVIGAGVIGLELGSVWSRFGSKTVLLEALPDFLPICDARVARDAKKIFEAQGL